MNHPTFRRIHLTAPAFLAAFLLLIPTLDAASPSVEEQLKAARSALEMDRHEVVAEALPLTDAEAERFWPVYHEYRAAMEKHGRDLIARVVEYGELYPNVPDDRAKRMLRDLGRLERERVDTRISYLRKIGRVLSPSKTLRFAQVESRMDLALRMEMAASLPLVPVDGPLPVDTFGGAVVSEGSVGGVFVRTRELSATVVGIDPATRRVTLMSDQGIKEVVKVGPAAINFDQIRVGDRLKVEVTEEMVVEMGEPGSGDGGVAVVSLAPEGAKPGGLVAETTQHTGTVTAINLTEHTATLQFEDGSTRTFPVRTDIRLQEHRLGEKVVFRRTEMVAVSVEKP